MNRAGQPWHKAGHDAGARGDSFDYIRAMIPNEPKVTPELVAEHGLKPDEYERILKLIGREPTLTELGIFSAMWNEHCSYKSSKVHLRTLPTKAPWVIQGPGENAGVIDIGDGLACVFKMESHNHPSYIEPYQGAATGVGGILRDVFTMLGARPIACLNALSFGDPQHAKTRHLVASVVAGIGGYGNSFGVPTVGGQVRFHARYNGNCLVNAMAVGLADAGPRSSMRPRPASASRSSISARRPSRDGSIHGATMASAEFGADAEEEALRPCRSAIRSRKSCCSRPASKSCTRIASSRSRTWAPRGSPARRSRWGRRAILASPSSSTRCRAARPA